MASDLDKISIPWQVWESHFLGNLVANTPQVGVLAYTICAVLSQEVKGIDAFTQRLNFPIGEKLGEGEKKYVACAFSMGERDRAAPEDWEFLKQQFPPRVANTDFSKFNIDSKHSNLMKLADALQLPVSAKQLLTYLYLSQQGLIPAHFEKIMSRLSPALRAEFYARIFNDEKNLREYKDILKPESPLIMYGFLRAAGGLFISHRLLDLLGDDHLTPEEILTKILGKPGNTKLTIEDFRQFGESVTTAIEIMRNARAKGEKGVNILLYGVAGSGKTELAKAIAEAAGLHIYSVAEDTTFQGSSGDSDDEMQYLDEEGEIQYIGKKSGNDKTMAEDSTLRMGILLQVHALLAPNPKAIALFDEMEDVLPKGGNNDDPKNKVMLNRLLETNQVPTIWCANSPEKFFSALRQRFALSINVGFQPALTRFNIWKTQGRLNGIDVADDTLRQFARKYNIPPRIVAKAIGNFKLTGNVRDIERTIVEAARLTYGSPSMVTDSRALPKGFTPSLLSFKSEQDTFGRMIAAAKARRPWGMLVNSKGGLGEGELARHIGEEGYLHVQEMEGYELCQGSGPAEQNLREKFQVAADNNILLVVRNLNDLAADSGTDSVRGHWNNSLTRVLIQALMHHPLPFMLVHDKNGAGKDLPALPPEIARSCCAEIELLPLNRDEAGHAFKVLFDAELPQDVKMDSIGFNELCAARRTAEITPLPLAKIGEIFARHTAGGQPSQFGFGIRTREGR